MIKPWIYIKNEKGKGRGVFTEENIPSGTVVEESPVIVLEKKDRELLEKTLLDNYIFEWGEDKQQAAIALGYLSLYNHSYQSNCEYFMDFNDEIMSIKTVRDISSGEELCINYHGDWNNRKEVWFDTVSS